MILYLEMSAFVRLYVGKNNHDAILDSARKSHTGRNSPYCLHQNARRTRKNARNETHLRSGVQ